MRMQSQLFTFPNIDAVAFSIGPLDIRWYALSYITGILLGWLFLRRQIKQGRFIRCKSGTLNSNLWLTLANLMGLEIDSFADSNAVISDMWT